MRESSILAIIMCACATQAPQPLPAHAPTPAPAPEPAPPPAPARPPDSIDLARFVDARPVIEDAPDRWLAFERGGRRIPFTAHPELRKHASILRTQKEDAGCVPLHGKALWFFDEELAYDPARHVLRIRALSGCWWSLDLTMGIPLVDAEADVVQRGRMPKRVALDRAGVPKASFIIETRARLPVLGITRGKERLDLVTNPKELFVESAVSGGRVNVLAYLAQHGDETLLVTDVSSYGASHLIEQWCLVEPTALAARWCKLGTNGFAAAGDVDEEHLRITGRVALGGGSQLSLDAAIDDLNASGHIQTRVLRRIAVSATLGADDPIALWPVLAERAPTIDLSGQQSLEGTASGCKFAVGIDGLIVACPNGTLERTDDGVMETGIGTLRVIEHERFWLVEWAAGTCQRD